MMNFMFSMYAFGNDYKLHPEYVNLSDEEKANLAFLDSCFQSKNTKIRDASFSTMLLLAELNAQPDKYVPEEIHSKIEEIQKDLNEEEIAIMNNFMITCTSSMGVYSEKRVQERKLKMKGND